MYSLSVVIPNYNGIDLLKENIPFVYRALETSQVTDFEIIIADDASKDASIEFLKDNYPTIVVVENSINKGFSGNTNTGIKKATKDLVFILNSDVQLTENYFTPLLSYFSIEDTFGVMGRIISMDGEKNQDGAKYPAYQFSNIISTKNYICKDKDSMYTLFMSGANSLVDRKKLIELGGFNELFNPYYYEDVDMGLKAWMSGYKVYYNHTAVCKHPNSSTIKKEPNEKVQIISKRNKIYVHYLYLEGIELSFFMLKIILKAFFNLLFFKMNYVKSVQLFFKSLPELSAYKKSFQKKMTISEIISFIKKDIKNNQIEIF